MACLDMYNSEHKGPYAPMSPRISFSNDFVESQHMVNNKHEIRRGETAAPPPVSSDFEFSVSNYSMMSADELFFKGRLLPFKDNCTGKTTLREELLVVDEEEEEEEEEEEVVVSARRPPKGGGSSTRWKGLLGLKRTHIGSKKSDKTTSSDQVEASRRPISSVHEDRGSVHLSLPRTTSSPQETLNDGGGPSRRDNVEFWI